MGQLQFGFCNSGSLFSPFFLPDRSCHRLGGAQTKGSFLGLPNRGARALCFLPALGQRGVSFLSFLTILPTCFGKMLPPCFLQEHPNWEDLRPRPRSLAGSSLLHHHPFTRPFHLLMQGLILHFDDHPHRKEEPTLPAFSKPSARFFI